MLFMNIEPHVALEGCPKKSVTQSKGHMHKILSFGFPYHDASGKQYEAPRLPSNLGANSMPASVSWGLKYKGFHLTKCECEFYNG